MLLGYHRNLVWDYINGEYIDNIDILEDDCKFMMDVINVTNDKKIYYLCSDNVKKNYEFVKFIIYKFKNDKDFIHDIALEYLNNTNEYDITFKELCFIMSDIFNNYEDDRSIFYNLKKCLIYTNERMSISMLISEEIDNTMKDRLGLGFIFILFSDLAESDIITRYFASRYLSEIFYEKDKFTLESLLHIKFSNVNKLKKVGIKKFILDYVRDYDIALSDYLFAHVDLISELEKSINRIICTWDVYCDRLLDRKNSIFFQEVNELISLYDASFDYFDVCSYIDNHNINIPVKLSYFEECNDFNSINLSKISFNDYKCLKEIIKLAKDLYLSSVIDVDYNYNKNDSVIKKSNNKILEYKPGNN